jgi:selenocysteine lyase/cysteine desulfurase
MLMPAAPVIASLRHREFSRLDDVGCAYLDYAAASLYPASLVRRDAKRLMTTVLGNPHSESGPSLASTAAIDTARRLTLELLDADAAEYDVVFTANASGAIRIVAEAFPFAAGSRLVLTADNHNSVNGLRVPARRRRAEIDYVPLDAELRSGDPRPALTRGAAPSLFAFPAQSNFSGVRHPLDWVAEAQQRGYRVLLDAAAYTPTAALSLAETPADFVALSFYKMFGYPTGVGALVARREALAELRRAYFAGGTVQFASVQHDRVRLKAGGEAFEDGTPSFLAMPAVCDGLRWWSRVGLAHIARHVADLTTMLLAQLEALGDRVVIYGPRDLQARGGIVAFNVRRGGGIVPYEEVEAAARERGVAIRGGCFCNPGAAEHAFQLPAAVTDACLRGDFSIARLRACAGHLPVGALRASVGLATQPSDIDRLVDCLVARSA